MRNLPSHIRVLPQLLAMDSDDLTDRTFYGRAALIAKLAKALRAERARGLAGHWSYDLPRHVAMLAIYRRETAAFQRDFGERPLVP